MRRLGGLSIASYLLLAESGPWRLTSARLSGCTYPLPAILLPENNKTKMEEKQRTTVMNLVLSAFQNMYNTPAGELRGSMMIQCIVSISDMITLDS